MEAADGRREELRREAGRARGGFRGQDNRPGADQRRLTTPVLVKRERVTLHRLLSPRPQVLDPPEFQPCLLVPQPRRQHGP